MKDYIDRAALGIDFCDRSMFHDPLYADGWNNAIQIIKDAPRVDVPESNDGKWIPVSERLPEKGGEHLVYCGGYDGISILYYEILKTRGKWRTKWKEVTHWMPLPAAPKGE